MKPKDQSPAAVDIDYRASHLTRGGTYDATLGSNPFDIYMARREAEFLKATIPGLFQRPPAYVDFACGTGRITTIVAPLSAHATGIDVSPSMLAEARRKLPGVGFIQADITRSMIEREPTDLVTSFRFFGNAGDELRRAALRAINRLLKPQGYFILNSHMNPHAIATLLGTLTGMEHDMDLTLFKLKRLLREFGFRVVQQRPIGFWMYRSRLMLTSDVSDERVERLERRFSGAFLAPFAPDTVVVAQKIAQA